MGLAACGSSGGTEPPPQNNGGGGGPVPVTVTVGNNDYSPNNVSVAAGSTVTWRWDRCSGDGYGGEICTSHSVTFDDGGPSAAAKEAGTFARTFGTGGTYTYYCTAHGRTAMSGRVVVQ
jgi:plastocyanin